MTTLDPGLAGTLLAAGYHEAVIADLLEVPGPFALSPWRRTVYRRKLGADRRLGALVELFLLGGDLEGGRLRRDLGPDLAGRLDEAGLLVARGERIAGRFALVPCAGVVVAADHRFPSPGRRRPTDPVALPGSGSFDLARLVAASPAATVLDLGTGSGLLALVAAAYGAAVTAVDINPRAVGLARRCGHWNSLAGSCRFLVSDLDGALPREARYELIVAQPPFVPADGAEPPSRRVGRLGERVTARLLGRLPGRLAAAGRALITACLVDGKVGSRERLAAWSAPGLGLTFHRLRRRPIEEHVAFYVEVDPWRDDPATYDRRCERWLEALHRAGARAVDYGVLVARHDPHQGVAIVDGPPPR